ncbi:MAG: aromatic ring-hydroxylating dioxygenase subunit alpha [Actinobacteria bacterium]|nr:aromatic ring-hydroxylating dioxygenase subunit alpha [Actinomycetota bacterium]
MPHTDAQLPVTPPGPSVQELLDREQRPVPEALRDVAFAPLGSAPITRERYFSYGFHRREVERLWRRVWQMACREEEIPEVGDYFVYDIVDDSLIVVRTAPNEIRAFHNSCLHRGTRLCDGEGRARSFRCSFHGWTWDLDGRLLRMPSEWDFPHVEQRDLCLPEARVACWGGFVFVNLDPECEPFDSFLEILPEQFRAWPMAERWKALHVCKAFRCNWKVALEAFIESYHVITTHPQIMGSTGDTNTQYDTWPGVRHVNRMITPFAVASPTIASTMTEQEIAESMVRTGGRDDAVDLPEGMSARAFMGEQMRTLVKSALGVDASERTDSEMLDAIEYYLFPNLAPWAGVLNSLVYRFRPNGDDPDSCLMDIMRLHPVPDLGERPPPVAVHHLGLDDPFDLAPELGGLVEIFRQDSMNLPKVQRGLKSSGASTVNFGLYQESRLRHYHATLDEYLARD